MEMAVTQSPQEPPVLPKILQEEPNSTTVFCARACRGGHFKYGVVIKNGAKSQDASFRR